MRVWDSVEWREIPEHEEQAGGRLRVDVHCPECGNRDVYVWRDGCCYRATCTTCSERHVGEGGGETPQDAVEDFLLECWARARLRIDIRCPECGTQLRAMRHGGMCQVFCPTCADNSDGDHIVAEELEPYWAVDRFMVECWSRATSRARWGGCPESVEAVRDEQAERMMREGDHG